MKEFQFLIGLEGSTFIRFHFAVEAETREEAVRKANELIEENWGGMDVDSFYEDYTSFCIYFGSQVRASEKDIVEEDELLRMHQIEMNRRGVRLDDIFHPRRSE